MTVKHFIKFFLLISAPVLFSFLGQAYVTDEIWVSWHINELPMFEHIPISIVKDYLTLVGIALTMLPLGILYILNNIKNDRHVESKQVLISYIRDILINAVEAKIHVDKSELNIRIFVPKNKYLYWLAILLSKINVEIGIKFTLKNIHGYNGSIRNGLELSVYPAEQGLVGLCFARKEMVYGDRLKTQLNDYNFDEYQKQVLSLVDFGICIPIIDKSNHITAILTLDSCEPIVLNDETNKYELFCILNGFIMSMGHEIVYLFD
ncbi:hypothetical protein FRZ06_10485 [Anoxybacterium hadale]|uniref:Uncharacterized protein n=1 Tax=Anoxybacterium hadale TaxID=3408580 RepID=A0ACD1ABP4_9FIRM|nr:hypothetical protein FRZ06_10485 [Clostridiales bacterium]